MTILIWLVATLSTGIVGLVGTGVVTNAYTGWYRVSNFEGGSGYLVLLMAGLGGVCGLLLGGIVAGIALAGHGRFAGWAACFLAWAIALTILGAIALGLRLFADIPPRMEGHRVRLEIELRLPEGAAPPTVDAEAQSWIVLVSDLFGVRQSRAYGRLRTEDARLEDGRWTVASDLDVHTYRGRLHLSPQSQGESPVGFAIEIPRRPDPSSESWSEWLPRGAAHTRVPETQGPATSMSYRYRLVPKRPAAQMSPVDREQAALDEERGRFEALTLDEPLAQILPFVLDARSPEIRQRALDGVRRRRGLLSDLRAVVLDDDAQSAAKGLRTMELLLERASELAPLLEDAGTDIADRIERFTTSTPQEDPDYSAAADASVRFSAWMAALRAFRSQGIHLGEQALARILELSRLRPDSQVMQADIRRVASHYLNEWAGVAPLPGDPPPR